MLFDTPAYIIFLTLVVLLYWRLNFRSQNLFLLAASYFFYGWWDYRFLLLMMGSTVIDYVIGRRIASSTNEGMRKSLLALSLVLNFSFLGFFKYCNFFIGSFIHVADTMGLHGLPVVFFKIILPPGISFYTFQEVAYIVDVYKRRLPPAQSLVDYALFIGFFPHLIAGPIQRPDHLLPQVQTPRQWDPDKAFDGLLLILEGLFRKCVIADQCALIANAVFDGRFGKSNVLILLLGMYAFAWQIYGDFSGYSNIARGSAQLFGFHFMLNFRQPYLAKSLQDFWRRWHISLSTWLRDYLYIPLGGSRWGAFKTYRNLLVTMVLGGLWHGANWTFVIWGSIHGLGLAVERMMGIDREDSHPGLLAIWVRRLVVFHLVGIGWIFFRANSFAQAIELLRGIGVWHWESMYSVALKFLALFTVPLFLLDAWLERTGDEYLFQSLAIPSRLAYALSIFFAITLFGGIQPNAFIYFQF